MLRLIFQSQPLTYRTAEPPGAPHPFGATYPKNGPYVEKLGMLEGGFIIPTDLITGLGTQPEDKPPVVSTIAPMSLVIVGTANVTWWPSYETQAWQWDARTGKYIGLVPVLSNVGGLFIQQMHRSRQGTFYVEMILSDGLLEFNFGGAIPGGKTIPASRAGLMAWGAPLGIDDVMDRILRGSGSTIDVYQISTGKKLLTREMPASCKAICLEDDERAYILLENRQLVLFDYMRGDVMGSSKVGFGAWGQGSVALAWDNTVRRVLLYELVPDVNNASVSKWKGYRPVPEPVRLTVPIPLKPPRKDRIIPVMTQVVGDSNEPVGGYIVTAVVTGDAALVGTPTTDGLGTALVKVKCGLDQPPSSAGPSGGGSPPDELTYTNLDATGVRPDIGYFEGHTYIVYETAVGALRVLRDGMETYLVTGTAPGAFPRVVGKSCIFRDGTQAVYWPDLDQGPVTWQILDPQCSGDHPVALNPSFLMWQTGPGYQIKFKNRSNSQPGTSGLGNAQGISRVTKNGPVLMTADATRADMNGNVWGRKAAFASSLIVCEALEGGGAVIRMNDEPATEIRLWEGEVVQEPRIAVYDTEVSVVCFGGTGIRLAEFSTDEILQYTPGDAAGWGTGTGGSGAGTDPLAPIIGRDLFFGYFFQFSAQYGNNLNAPGNWTFVNDAQSIAPAIQNSMKLVVGGPAIQAAVGNEASVIGLYCEGGTEAALSAAAQQVKDSAPATLAGKLVIGTFDGGSGNLPTSPIDNVDWLALECYVGVNETAAQCQERIQTCMNALGSAHSYVLIGQSYTSNATNTSNPQTLIDAQYIPANIAKVDERVVGILMFSDGRPTGTRDHESWRPIHRAIYAGIGDGATGTPGGVSPPPGTFHIKVSVKLALPPPTTTGGPGTGTPPGTGPGGTGLIWAWSDLHTNPNPPDAPGSQPGAPTTLAQWESYFFGLIGKTKGTPADDYVEVLKDLQTRGMKVNPIQGEVPSTSWPFFGMSLMVDGGGAGNPRGRIWLPTAVANDAGYYTYEIQVIGNAPAGGGGTFGPNEMPNMKHVVDAIYAAGPPGGGAWDLQDSNQFNPNGRGVFTGLCVDAMHAEDPRFGHFNKTPPHTRYEGHAVDAVCFINDDGLSQEGADIVRGGTSGDLTQWGAYDRSARTPDGQYNCWIYPANAANGTGGG